MVHGGGESEVPNLSLEFCILLAFCCEFCLDSLSTLSDRLNSSFHFGFYFLFDTLDKMLVFLSNHTTTTAKTIEKPIEECTWKGKTFEKPIENL